MDDFIGIFDSGIGGLTVYSKIVEAFKMKILSIWLILKIVHTGQRT